MYFLQEDDRDDLHRVLARAAVDREFRQKLIANPHAAIKEATGIELAPTFKIRFVEQPTELDALVVLPNVVATPTELSESELEAVAGGDDSDSDSDDDGGDFGVCWRTCGTTCKTTCVKTCDITGVVVPTMI